MNKSILLFFEKYAIAFEKDYGYGQIDGYEVNIYENKFGMGPIMQVSTYMNLTDKKLFLTRIKDKKIKYLSADVDEYGLTFILGALTVGTFLKNAPNTIEIIFNLLKEFNAAKSDICPCSGVEINEMNSRIITVPNTKFKVRLSNESIARINIEVEKANQEYNYSDNNYLKGFLGILVGGVAGVVLSIVFALIGLISAISSMFSVWLGITLYKKFGGKQNAIMIIMSFLTTLVFIIGFNFFAYNNYANLFVQENNILLGDSSALKFCFEYVEDFKSSFVSDMGFTVLFCIIGEAAMIGSLIKSIRRPKSI